MIAQLQTNLKVCSEKLLRFVPLTFCAIFSRTTNRMYRVRLCITVNIVT